MKPQFVTDERGHKIKVLISYKEYKHFQELLEEEEDCKLYDQAKKDTNEQTFTIDEVAKEVGYEV